MYEQIYHWLTVQLADNDVFIGIVGASAIGTLLFVARSVPATLWRLAVRHLTVELEVRSNNPAFEWIRLWLSRHPYGSRARRLRLTARESSDYDELASDQPDWTLAPGEGLHLFTYRGRPVALWYTVEDNKSGGRFPVESFVLRAPGRNQGFLRDLVTEAVMIGSTDDRVRIYGWFGGYWQLAARKRRRPLDTVVMPEGMIELVAEDAGWFFGAADWYVDRGVPYRRGYLFSGPPGTGKSSLAFALASHFGKPLYTLNLSAVYDDSGLEQAFARTPEDAILLIEDIDAWRASVSRDNADASGAPGAQLGPTLAGLLNVVDGVAAADGRLLIMTSNHPENLDPALVRPGRIDLRVPFRLLGRRDVRRMYLRFHPGEEAMADQFANLVPAPVSAAELQRRLMGSDPMAGLNVRIAPAAAE